MSFKDMPSPAHNIPRDQRIRLLSLLIDVKKFDHDKMNHSKELVLESKPKAIPSFLHSLNYSVRKQEDPPVCPALWEKAPRDTKQGEKVFPSLQECRIELVLKG